MASWAIFLDRPSDLGYSDEGYRLPEMDIHWHELPSDHSLAGREKTGQGRLIKNAAIGLPAASREKQDSIDARVAKLIELRAIDPAAHRLVWHDLENERKAPYCAVKLKRRGIGIELNPRYALDGARFCEMAESEVAAPSLFEFLEHTAEETVGASA